MLCSAFFAVFLTCEMPTAFIFQTIPIQVALPSREFIFFRMGVAPCSSSAFGNSIDRSTVPRDLITVPINDQITLSDPFWSHRYRNVLCPFRFALNPMYSAWLRTSIKIRTRIINRLGMVFEKLNCCAKQRLSFSRFPDCLHWFFAWVILENKNQSEDDHAISRVVGIGPIALFFPNTKNSIGWIYLKTGIGISMTSRVSSDFQTGLPLKIINFLIVLMKVKKTPFLPCYHAALSASRARTL